MITCSKCGAMVEGNPDICPECGAKIVQDEAQAISSNDKPQNGESAIGEKSGESKSVAVGVQTSGNTDEEKKIIVKNKDILVRILLFILVACVGYLTFLKFREKNIGGNIDSSNRVLAVYMDSDLSTDQSDMTQINNAFDNGGMIKIDTNNISTEFRLQIESYGAVNSDGMYLVSGAVLNYIASRGWNLLQAPTTGMSNFYYFTK